MTELKKEFNWDLRNLCFCEGLLPSAVLKDVFAGGYYFFVKTTIN